MMKYIGNVEKVKADELMTLWRRLKALKDLHSTLSDLSSKNQNTIDISKIQPEVVETEIRELSEKKKNKLEEIRMQEGWSKELMAKIHIMENCKAYIDTDR